MGIEIEHKFLVANELWRENITKSTHLVQGYLPARSGEPVVRIRLDGQRARLTLKGVPHGITRSEFEYDIPLTDGQEMLQEFAADRRIEKIRHLVPGPDGAIWELDEYLGKHAGLFVAELELQNADDEFARPPWLGENISGNFHFTNFYLSNHSWREILAEIR